MKNIAIPLRTSGWLRRTAFCAAATLGLSVARPAAGASYYVNDTGTEGDLWCVTPGDDTNDGLTPGTPVASLHTILGRYTLLPADTVFVDAGTYLLTSNIVVEARHSGTNNAPVTFQGMGRTTVLNRNNTSSTARGMFLQASHVRIQGLTFTGAYVGLYIDTTVSTSATVRENVFHHNAYAGVQISGAVKQADYLLANNLLYGNPYGLWLVYRTSVYERLKIINNTILASTAALYFGFQASTQYQTEVRNNILVGEGNGICLDFITAYPGVMFQSDHNNLWRSGSNSVPLVRGRIQNVFYTYTSLADWQWQGAAIAGRAVDSSSISRDPLFADPGSGDFHLRSLGGRWLPDGGSPTGGVWIVDGDHSPCIDSGSPTNHTADLELEPAPNGDRKNMGAYGGTAQASVTAPGRILMAFAPAHQNPNPQQVGWVASGAGWASNETVVIDYSLDGGWNWTPAEGGEVPAGDGVYLWFRPDGAHAVTNRCQVRISCVADPEIFDVVEIDLYPLQATYYVNDAGTTNDVWCAAPGDDANDGLTPETPMATLQALLSRYRPGAGSTIHVDSGHYKLATTLFLPNNGSTADPGATNAWLRLVGAGRERTVLDGGTLPIPCLRIQQNGLWIEGLVIRGGTIGLYFDSSSCRYAVVTNNVLKDNRSGAIHAYPMTAPYPYPSGPYRTGRYTLRNNLICNTANGFRLITHPHPWKRIEVVMENNTVSVNGGVGVALRNLYASATLRNNIIAVKGAGWCLNLEYAYSPSFPLVSDFNNFHLSGGAGVARGYIGLNANSTAPTLQDWQRNSGLDTFSLGRDPLFVAPAAGNYHLRSVHGAWNGETWIADTLTSPCLDAGDPASPFALELVPSGGRINMGAYGNTPEASRSGEARRLILHSPVGGEIWPQPVTVTWSAAGPGWESNDVVHVEYAVGDGGAWTAIAGADALPPMGTFSWTAPNPDSMEASYRLRVVCNRDAAVFDMTGSPGTVKRTGNAYYLNDGATAGDVYCTAPGSDAHPGDAPERPACSLNGLLQKVTLMPGDVVYWDAGVYTQEVDAVIGATHKGTRGAPIRIVGVPGATHLIRAGSGTGRRGLLVEGNHIRVEGLVCSQAAVGIAVNGATAAGVWLVGNVCSNNTEYGIHFPYTGAATGREFHILQNVVSGNVLGGMNLQCGLNGDLKPVFFVENNTVYEASVCARLACLTYSNRRTHVLKNNAFQAAGAGAKCLVTRPGTLQYSDYNNLHAPDGFVGAWEGSSSFATLEAWRAASGQDRNSISADSQFADPAAGDLRISSGSPCMDAGVLSYWMLGTADAAGNSRITGASVDIGAYEVCLRVAARVFLQGVFAAGTDAMRTDLAGGGLLPATSPYAADPRTAAVVPANAVDWVLVQFRETADGPDVFSRSAFVRADGWIVTDTGASVLDVDLQPGGAYHVVVKHRNHLAAMSDNGLVFEDGLLTADFTGAAFAYHGGSDGFAEVTGAGSAVWRALRAGDVDGDGAVLPVDESVRNSHSGDAEYRRGDTSLNGIVDAATDDDLIAANQGKASPVPRPETWLTTVVQVTPAQRTVQAGEKLVLIGQALSDPAAGDSNPDGDGAGALPFLNWAFARKESGSTASLAADGTNRANYTAGSLTEKTDLVQAWDDADAIGRAVLNVVGAETAATAGQALILAGRTSPTDTLWPATDYLANLAYTTLRYRGFSKANIHYLSPEPGRDIDGNGQPDDIAGGSTFANAALALTNRVAGADRLFVYLVDHGGHSSGNGYFRLNAGETLTAVQLDAWLDALQNASGTEVTVLLDFCYAGTFLSALNYTGSPTRIVIAACGDDEPSYFVAGGLVSFSGAFFSGLMLGYNVSNCYSMAASAMSGYQEAQLDDPASLAGNAYIGPSNVAPGDTPVIGEVCARQTLTQTTAATLWIGSVSSTRPITRAWCLVVPPGHNPNPDNPVVDIPAVELVYQAATGRYLATHDGFGAPGTYNVSFYVQDAEGNVSLPREAYVSQVGYTDRAILVAGGDVDRPTWPAVDYLVRLAYETFRLRLFTPERMFVMTPAGDRDFDGDGLNDVSAPTTAANLEAAIGDWAGTNRTDRLFLYLIGQGAGQSLTLNSGETVDAQTFAGWIDDFQNEHDIPVTVVLDFAGAAGFLKQVSKALESTDAVRILIASSGLGEEAIFANRGTASFTQYFLTGIAAGQTIGDAYQNASKAVRGVSMGRQRGCLDDNRNSVPNEKGDGRIAAITHLGTAFVTGADLPVIGDVMPPVAPGSSGEPLVLWADNVTGMNPISNVWCVVTPPDAAPEDDLRTITLNQVEETGRYEVDDPSLAPFGVHVLTFYAQDTAGTLSAPVQSEVIFADEYEPDDVAGQAPIYYGAPQVHTFHTPDDADWVRVYLASNFCYQIDTLHLSESLDTVLEVFRENPDGTLAQLLEGPVDSSGTDGGESASLLWPESGWYLIKVSPFVGESSGVGAYSLNIWIPTAAACNLIVLGVDDVSNGALPSGSYASVYSEATKATQAKYFSGSKNVSFTGLASGWYRISVPKPAHHICREDPDTPGQVESLYNTYYANPRRIQLCSGWVMAGFEFLSTVEVTSGLVRDDWTGAFINNAKFTFTATSDNLSGAVVDGHIMLASYSTDWKSTAAGLLPANVILGACNWNLAVSCTGYTTANVTDAIKNKPAGSTIALGTIYLTPIDTNSNGIRDTWENAAFPGGCDPDADSDGDGLSNRAEYLCGTGPINSASVMRILDVQRVSGGLALTWSAVAGRSYQVVSSGTPGGTGSVTTNGPWEAAYGETTKTWADPDAASSPSRFYRIHLALPF